MRSTTESPRPGRGRRCPDAALVGQLLLGLAACQLPRSGHAWTGNMPLRLMDNATVQEYGAFCLDGSRPGYYYQLGEGAAATNWRVHIRGGAWCTSLESCAQRANTTLGTSTLWPPFINETLDDAPFGFMDDNTTNPFGAWNL
jgi:hypothetical protein